jgi:hypothetical protein
MDVGGSKNMKNLAKLSPGQVFFLKTCLGADFFYEPARGQIFPLLPLTLFL